MTRQKRRQLLLRAHAKLDKGLDLVRFIRYQRVQMMAIMCLLSPQQTSLLQTQRHLTVHEDGTKEASSSDIESTDTEANKLQLDKALTKMR